MTEKAYLDWNATAPLRPQARAAMLAAADVVGNPSSVHAEGRAARHLVERARAQVASLVGAQPRDVVFTSGGTEANMLALTPAIEIGRAKAPRDRLLVSAIEHPVRAHAAADLPQVHRRTPGGWPRTRSISRRSNSACGSLPHAGNRPLVSIMLANNETGVIQPIAASRRHRPCRGRSSACRRDPGARTNSL